jgi:hypothetical protein
MHDIFQVHNCGGAHSRFNKAHALQYSLLVFAWEEETMPPAAKLPVPTGKLGIAFKGSPPVVKSVAEDSPMFGKVKPGYVFEALYLDDGTVFEGLSTHELVAVLNEYSDQEGRKMKLKMGLPDSVELTLPQGNYGAAISDVGGKPTITRITSDSPLKALLRIGMVVHKVTLEDGCEMSGHKAQEIIQILEGDSTSTGRKLLLKNPSVELPPKEVVLCKKKVIELPTGMLGVTFKSSDYTYVSAIKPDSPMHSHGLRVGLAVDTLKFQDKTEFRGLDAMDLTAALKHSSDAEGRIMILKRPGSKDLPKTPTTTVFLPSLGNAQEFGLEFVGNPAAVKSVSESSPFVGKLRPGQIVLTVGAGDGTEYDELDAEELYDVMQDSSGGDGRFLTLENANLKKAKKTVPQEVVITLPPGKIGVAFKGSPPIITRINEDSPIRNDITVGMAVDTLTLEDGEILYGMDAVALTSALADNIESEKRVVRFINPATTELTKAPEIPKPEELEIILPTGKLGIGFSGDSPPIVTTVKRDSPLANELPLGMGVDTLTIGKIVYMDMSNTELVGVLNETTDIDDRVLKLKDPEVPGVEFSRTPDSYEVSLPDGKLGVVFKGVPPVPTTYKEDSPVEGLFPTGMFVDSLTLEDGLVMTGLGAKDLVVALGDSSEEKGRTLLFKNIKTQDPSDPGVVLPDEKKIILPTGKLGVSFKGRDMARASRISDESPVRGIIRVGMVVDTIDLPNGRSYAGLTAKETARVLVNTMDIEGRVMVLKNPMTMTLTPRNVTIEDNASVVTGADDTAGDELSQRV